MQFKHLGQSEVARKIVIWALSIGFLFFGFFSNTWRVADQNWFATHQKDTEAHIMEEWSNLAKMASSQRVV